MVPIEVRVAGQDLRLELIGRGCGDEVNCAAGRISPVKGSLWSTKHFDSLQIDLIESGGCGACLIDTVDINGHARLRGDINQIHPHTTNGDLTDTDGVARLEIRRLELQVLDIANAAGRNFLGSKC